VRQRAAVIAVGAGLLLATAIHATPGCSLGWQDDAEAAYQPVQPPSVGRMSRSFVDEARPRWGGPGPRPLDVLVWYPAESGAVESDWVLGSPADPLFRLGRSTEGARPATRGGRRPLVVLSHGTGGSAAMLAWLGEGLASAGYIAAGVNHHGNTSAEPSPTAEGFMLWWERATDLTRALDRLARDPTFGALIDGARIGAAGFSLGGYSVLALAGARTNLDQWSSFCGSAARDSTCDAQPEFPEALARFEKVRQRPDVRSSLERHGDSFRDPRIRGVFAMAPVGSWLTAESLREIDVPVRIVVGTHDSAAPMATNAGRVAGLIPGARLLTLERVGHYTFLPECGGAGASSRPDLCRDESGVDRAAVHRKVTADAVEFFSTFFGSP
jgi:predicted dienelactone hydrolase